METGKIVLLIVSMGLAVLGLSNLSLADSDEQKKYDEKSIRGKWGFWGVGGHILPPATPEPVPIASIGSISFDGDGQCKVVSYLNIGGEFPGRMESDFCTYSVTDDGFGVADATFSTGPAPGSLPVAFVIMDYGNEIRFINTSTILGGFIAKRQ